MATPILAREFLRPPNDGRSVDGAEDRYRSRAHTDVLSDVKVREQLRVLIDRSDPGATRLDWRIETRRRAVQFNVSGAWFENSGDDFD